LVAFVTTAIMVRHEIRLVAPMAAAVGAE